MTPAQQALVLGVGFVAGSINGIAGGGSLVSFPVLVAIGLPPLAANVTSCVGMWPGYFGGMMGFRVEAVAQASRIRSLVAATVAGAGVGAALLLTTSADAFAAVVPYLILGAGALFVIQPVLTRRILATATPLSSGAPTLDRRVALQASTFLAAVYGGYFGAGLGVILLAIFGTLLPDRLTRTNALRGAVTLAANTVAAVAFIGFAPVRWETAGIMALGSVAGGYGGARFSRRLPAPVLRVVVVLTCLVAAVRLLA